MIKGPLFHVHKHTKNSNALGQEVMDSRQAFTQRASDKDFNTLCRR